MEKNKPREDDETVVERRDTAAPTTPAPAKRTKRADAGGASSGAGAVCDDVVGNILARLPACMALSKHHRRLIRSPEFRSLHCRLAPPLSRPHLAYLVTTPIKRNPDTGAISRFHGFHIVGTGAGNGGGALMRALAGGKYLNMSYVEAPEEVPKEWR
ncbi:unnamed protein product [Urochloa humidicola]